MGNTEEKLSHIRNLVVLAHSDGHFDESEEYFIRKVGLKCGLSERDIKLISMRPESVNFLPPKNYEDRVEQLYDLISIILIDNEIHDNEMVMCKKFAKRLGFNDKIVDQIVLDIKKYVEQDISSEEAMEELKKYEDIRA